MGRENGFMEDRMLPAAALLLGLVAYLAFSPGAAAQIYKYTDDDGIVFRFRVRTTPLPLPILVVAEGISGEAKDGIAWAHFR